MPPRLSLQPLARQCRSCLSQWTAAFSTTAPVAALRNLSSPASSVLSLDDEGTPRAPRQPLDATDRVRNLLVDSEARRQRITDRKKSTLERMRAKKLAEDFSRQMTRRWKVGDVYAPHDLSPEEMVKWKQAQRPTKDILDMLGLNPLDEYRNFSIMSEFMTSTGRIKHSSETGLRPVNQRKVAKAIRRSIGLGIHPSVHRHPMILMNEVQNMPKQRVTAKSVMNPGRSIRLM